MNEIHGLAIAFVVVAGGFAVGNISGAHFNPAVTCASFDYFQTGQAEYILQDDLLESRSVLHPQPILGRPISTVQTVIEAHQFSRTLNQFER